MVGEVGVVPDFLQAVVMTEHEHMPPISRYTARWLTKDRILVKMPRSEYVLRRADAEKLVDELKATLNAQEPTE